MNLNAKQEETKSKVTKAAMDVGIDPKWASAVAFIESSFGENQKSPTGCRGVFQMSSIAVKDLLLEMEKKDDDLIDIYCGCLYLRLLLKRHGSIDKATGRFCDPKDVGFYVDRVKKIMGEL